MLCAHWLVNVGCNMLLGGKTARAIDDEGDEDEC